MTRRRAKRVADVDYDRSGDLPPAEAGQDTDPETTELIEFYKNERPPHYGGD
ncbi:hypothetical protein [uncultured Corynebacterium sp.]|uniref:hypothetical protein n=1 Tax=uncultured Corynebacterium sp. TaxID=159447 RepID=UPI002591F0DF|nr:hypothetical protein [uncultured Corynebacterium sp.]